MWVGVLGRGLDGYAREGLKQVSHNISRDRWSYPANSNSIPFVC